ncbi:hypothetical protein [Salinicoccus cyprini]|uniref:hypothetical protein n=1 Tax=Salinicoccus cyprini TaxID=2493691 RepID=UPI0016437623|nr:hypothetical protein [Salinicoccus cyprini]
MTCLQSFCRDVWESADQGEEYAEINRQRVQDGKAGSLNDNSPSPVIITIAHDGELSL